MYNIIHCIYKDKEDKDEHFFNWTRKSKLQDYKDSKYFLFDRKLLQNSDNQKVLDLKN